MNYSNAYRKNNLTQSQLKQELYYNPLTGLFYHKYQKNGRVKANTLAGCKGLDYVFIGVMGESYKAHRLAWLYMTGKFPKIDIDHKDKNPFNNAFGNLRLATQVCNQRNRKISVNNTSGIKGVSFCVTNGKWVASLRYKGRTKTLGYYLDKENAICARLAGEQCLDWLDCDLSSPAYTHVTNWQKEMTK